ncbi:MAG: cytochrome c oxidase subunit 3 [Dehalococcoidia bacterium]
MAVEAAAVPPTAPERSRLPVLRFGLWLFFVSDSLLFALLATSRFYLVGTETPDELSQVLGLGITSILLLSSLTAYRAETAIAHGNVRHAKLMLLATIALGLIFLSGVAIEWTIAEFTPSDGFGTAFFSMTGMHATHVGSGVLVLAMVYGLLQRGRFSAGSHWGVAATVMYWHFVDVVWVFFYPVLYLVN